MHRASLSLSSCSLFQIHVLWTAKNDLKTKEVCLLSSFLFSTSIWSKLLLCFLFSLKMCSNDETRILVLEEQVKNLSDELMQCQVWMSTLDCCTTFLKLFYPHKKQKLLRVTSFSCTWIHLGDLLKFTDGRKLVTLTSGRLWVYK